MDAIRSRQGVIDLFLTEFSKLPFARAEGPNNSVLLFYGFGKHNVIVQVFPDAGWDVYVNDGQNKAQVTLDWLRSLEGGNVPDQRTA